MTGLPLDTTSAVALAGREFFGKLRALDAGLRGINQPLDHAPGRKDSRLVERRPCIGPWACGGVRYHDALLRKYSARYPIPKAITLEDFDAFVQGSAGKATVQWSDTRSQDG